MKWTPLPALLLSAALSLTLAPPAWGAEEAPWYAQAQSYVTQKGLFFEVEGGFDPAAPATRGTVFQTLWSLEGRPLVSKPFLFSDVSPDLWYAPASSWAKDFGVSDGDAGAFRGERVITRAELAAVFARYLAAKGFPRLEEPDMTRFADWAEVPDWAGESMGQCVAYGILTGGEGRLMPAAEASQAELAVMLTALDQLTPPERPDAAVYVDGLCQALYHSRYSQELLALSGLSRQQAQAAAKDHWDQLGAYFLELYNVEYPTAGMEEDAADILSQAGRGTQVEVLSAAPAEDGLWAVTLSVTPTDLVPLTDAAMEEAMAPFYEKYPAVLQPRLTKAEYRDMDREWGEGILRLFRDKLPQAGTLDRRTVTLCASQSQTGRWSISPEDQTLLDNTLFAFFPE